MLDGVPDCERLPCGLPPCLHTALSLPLGTPATGYSSATEVLKLACKTVFQTRPHLQVLGVKTRTCLLEATIQVRLSSLPGGGGLTPPALCRWVCPWEMLSAWGLRGPLVSCFVVEAIQVYGALVPSQSCFWGRPMQSSESDRGWWVHTRLSRRCRTPSDTGSLERFGGWGRGGPRAVKSVLRRCWWSARPGPVCGRLRPGGQTSQVGVAEPIAPPMVPL